MRYTLLELVQSILRAMESDEVSSISETREALDVADIVKECYFDIIGRLHPAEEEGLFKLDASGDNTKPTLMTVPSTVSKIDWIKYDHGDDTQEYNLLRYLEPVEVDNTDYTFYFRNDAHPTRYTILKDYYVIFDSFLLTEDDTLTQVRSLGFGQILPEWELEDTFVPNLDPRHFQLLLKEAKATAFTEMKQIENPRAERSARHNWVFAQKTRADNNPDSRQKHWTYGRK
jgi:hypothetical protein